MTFRNVLTNRSQQAKSVKKSDADRQLAEDLHSLRLMLLQRLISTLDNMFRKKGSGRNDIWGIAKEIQGELGGAREFVTYQTNMTWHEEQETTTFNGVGRAVTEDGRTIDFNVSLGMSRTFQEYAEIRTEQVVNLQDPLVIKRPCWPRCICRRPACPVP